ncbi:hypothetical protein [Xanthomonas retroflexus]|uniref:hypothetical protein n=1 Tax=Stenotrophomonas indicatrix TaxID=2045451 RepID=UPI000B453C7A
MNDETKINCSYSGDDNTTTLQVAVDGDVQVTVVLSKPGNRGAQKELTVEAAGKAVQLLLAVANG